MYNKKVKALFFKIVEKIVVEKSSYIVCVSNNMIDHFSRKYPSAKNKAFILPIFRVGGDEFECERKVANAYESINLFSNSNPRLRCSISRPRNLIEILTLLPPPMNLSKALSFTL